MKSALTKTGMPGPVLRSIVFSRSLSQYMASDAILFSSGNLVTEQTVIEIMRTPDELLYDSLTNRFVAIGRSRNVAVIYEKANGDFIII